MRTHDWSVAEKEGDVVLWRCSRCGAEVDADPATPPGDTSARFVLLAICSPPSRRPQCP